MVDFANINLCGASPELNSILSKLDDAKAEILAALDSSASSATAAFNATATDLAGLKSKLQTIEIPTLPKLNLQAEITSLISLPAGSPSFLSALAEIALEFGDDIKAAGLELESLVTSATSAILGGGNCCALVPNLEKEAGSLLAAVQNASGVKQAAENAITEASAVVNQDANVEAKVVAVKEKITSYKVTNTPPTEDSGAYTVAEETKKISVEKTVVTVTDSGQNSNVASPESSGHIHKPNNKTFYLTIDDLQISGSSITFKNLKHKPLKVNSIYVHPPTSADILVMPEQEIVLGGKYENRSSLRVAQRIWESQKKPPYYTSVYGPHMTEIEFDGVDINEDGSVTVAISSSIKPQANHPGNITSVYTYKVNFKRLQFEASTRLRVRYFRHREVTRTLKDRLLNKRYGGYAAAINYQYLDNYDADVET